MGEYRAAIAPGAEGTKRGLELGIQWVLARHRETGGRILVLVPRVALVEQHAALKAFAKNSSVTIGTKRNRRGFGAPIVLAAWVTAEDMAELEMFHSLEAVCLLPWDSPRRASNWVNAWAFANGAEALGDATPDRRVPVTLDPVVRVALTRLTSIGDFGTLGHGFIKSTVKRLAEAGYELPPADVEAYLIAQGFPVRLAREARDFAERVEDGHALREPKVGYLAGGAVDDWRREARQEPRGV